MKNVLLAFLLFGALFSCAEEEVDITQDPEIAEKKKELIDSIYGTWILNGIGYYEGTASTTIENTTQTEICNIISAKLEGISIGYELKITKSDDYIRIDKIYNCGEPWIYYSAYLNINLFGGTQARMEEYQSITTLINYHISDMSNFKNSRLFLWVEYDNRTQKRYYLIYKKKSL